MVSCQRVSTWLRRPRSRFDLEHPLRGGGGWHFDSGVGAGGAALITIALSLLAIQGVIGAFDTFYYHEWRAQLPALGKQAGSELKLHAARDFFYAILFETLPVAAWQGLWTIVLLVVIVSEIILTLWDFMVEISIRK